MSAGAAPRRLPVSRHAAGLIVVPIRLLLGAEPPA
jgi:hypothetical protein